MLATLLQQIRHVCPRFRRREGTQIFRKGAKPDVIHYVDSPKIADKADSAEDKADNAAHKADTAERKADTAEQGILSSRSDPSK